VEDDISIDENLGILPNFSDPCIGRMSSPFYNGFGVIAGDYSR
jgi:hypothetical protein